MIFVSVGAQMPFDRLIRTVDRWAGLRGAADVFAQIGDSNYKAQHIETARFINPIEFRKQVENARIIVAHAGMGSIITAFEFGKPMIVMPRRGDLGETRNDHQVATASHFAAKGDVIAAFSENELLEKLDGTALLGRVNRLNSWASEPLVTAIRSFLELTSTPSR
jgi:UDP-N-acetylglucosamine transferase subunit ALG13